MSNYIIDGQNLIDIANAIRTKNGTSNRYKPTQMANAINNLPLNSKDYTVTLTKASGWIKLVTLDSIVLQHVNDTNFQVSLVNTNPFVYDYYCGYAYFCCNRPFSILDDGTIAYGFANRMSRASTFSISIIPLPANNQDKNVSLIDKYLGGFYLEGEDYYIRPGDGFIAGGTYALRFSW